MDASAIVGLVLGLAAIGVMIWLVVRGRPGKAADGSEGVTGSTADKAENDGMRRQIDEVAEKVREMAAPVADEVVREARKTLKKAACDAVREAEKTIKEVGQTAGVSIGQGMEEAAENAEETVWQAATEATVEARKAVDRTTEEALKNAEGAFGEVEKRALESIEAAADHTASRIAIDAKEAVREAAKPELAKVEKEVRQAAADAMAKAMKRVGKEEGRALDKIKKAAAAAATKSQNTGRQVTEPVPVSTRAWVKRPVSALLTVLAVAALALAAIALASAVHQTGERTARVTNLLVSISAGVSDIDAVVVEDSIADFLNEDSVPTAACERMDPASPSPVEDSTNVGVLEYLARYRFPKMGLCSTTRSIVRRSELSGVLRVDKATDLVAWTENENADSTIVLAVSYDALPARTATKSDLWPLSVSLLMADSVLRLNGGRKKNLVMTITNIHEWRRLRASARNRSVIDKGHDNYVVKLNDDIVRAPFLPMVPPEGPQLAIGLLGPAVLAYPDSVAEGRLLSVSPLDVATMPLDTTVVTTRGVLRIPEGHSSDCCANDQLLAAAHDLLAFAQAKPSGGSSSARARLDWLDDVFTRMRVQSVSHRNQVDRWLSGFMWMLSIVVTMSLLFFGMRLVFSALGSRIHRARRTMQGIREKTGERNKRIGELDKEIAEAQEEEEGWRNRIKELDAELEEARWLWFHPIKLIHRVGNRRKLDHQEGHTRHLESDRKECEKKMTQLKDRCDYMKERLDKYRNARKGARQRLGDATSANLLNLVRPRHLRGVATGVVWAVVATVTLLCLISRGSQGWLTIAVGTATLIVPSLWWWIRGSKNRDRRNGFLAFCVGLAVFVYLYLSRDVPPEERAIGWSFDQGHTHLMILGVGVILVVARFLTENDVERREARIIREILARRVLHTRFTSFKGRMKVTLSYLLHLLVIVLAEALDILQRTGTVDSDASLGNGVHIMAVTIAAMTLPVVTLFPRTNRELDGRRDRPSHSETTGPESATGVEGDPSVRSEEGSTDGATDAEKRSEQDDE